MHTHQSTELKNFHSATKMMGALDKPAPTPCSTSLPLPSAARVDELLDLIRQRRNGTYTGPSEIVTPLNPDEYSAFKTALKAELRESDKLRWYWVQSRHQLHLRMGESYFHSNFAGEVILCIKDAVTTALLKLPPDSWAMQNMPGHIRFNEGGDFGPHGNSLRPDGSLGCRPGGADKHWHLIVEVARTQRWKDVVSKAEDYFDRIPYISALVIFKISEASRTTSCRGMYQIWTRASRTDSRPVLSPLCTFLENGAIGEKGALRLHLRDICLDMPDKEGDVEIDIPHDQLVEALQESEQMWRLLKKDDHEGDESAEDESEGDESEGDESTEEDERREREHQVVIQRLRYEREEYERQELELQAELARQELKRREYERQELELQAEHARRERKRKRKRNEHNP